ncbi:MAG TPA: cytochrome C [Alphaproteobacteria bacterium]|nr:cytochrome C [Alphaproteobacteria bacterium]
MTITTGALSKRARFPALLAAAAISAAMTPIANAADSNVARQETGLKIAPVPLNFKGLNKGEVGLGSYLVTVAQCNGCHTKGEFAPGGDPFDGQPFKVVKSAYFAGGVFFGGTLCSANITPDKNGLPDGLTLAHFLSAMKTGHDFRAPPKTLLQAMPWPYFRSMTTDDLTAIYAYLQALPSNKTPKCP